MVLNQRPPLNRANVPTSLGLKNTVRRVTIIGGLARYRNLHYFRCKKIFVYGQVNKN